MKPDVDAPDVKTCTAVQGLRSKDVDSGQTVRGYEAVMETLKLSVEAKARAQRLVIGLCNTLIDGLLGLL
ncbi:MAG: hypothetical protein ACMUIL_13835 [bacterium]